MLDREQLETFATVVEESSFERAAAVLNVTRGAVSQRIKALEESLATVLVVRERPVVQTVAGEVLLRHVKALRLLEDAALTELTQGDGHRGPVRIAIAVNADSLATWFSKTLWPLLLHRRIAIEIVTDDQDHTLDRLARGDVIGCISTARKSSSGFTAEALGAMEYCCYATPEFIHQYFAKGLTVQSVLEAPAVQFNRKDALHDEFLNKVFGFRVEQYTKHYVPSPEALLEGILAGIGYGLVPAMQAARHVESGDLLCLAPSRPVSVALFWHHWAIEPSLTQELTQLIVAKARAALNETNTQEAPSSESPLEKLDGQKHTEGCNEPAA